MTAAPVDLEKLTLAPLPPEAHHLLWGWLNEFPKANFDDTGPKDLEEFLNMLLAGAQLGVKIVGARHEDEWVGAISVVQTGPTSAMFKGICFTKSVHGSGIPQLAVKGVIQTLRERGIRKIRAQYFADNRRIHHFLKRLGFTEEAYLKDEAPRGGRELDVRQVALRMEGA